MAGSEAVSRFMISSLALCSELMAILVRGRRGDATLAWDDEPWASLQECYEFSYCIYIYVESEKEPSI